MHAIARLQLARALALSGDIVNAKSRRHRPPRSSGSTSGVRQVARGTRKRQPLRSRPSSRRRGERAARRESAALDAGDHWASAAALLEMPV